MKKTVSLLKALSDQNRLRVVAALLSGEEICACQIIKLLKVTGATVSRHMALLVRTGLVDSRKNGRWVYYRLQKENPELSALLQWLKVEFQDSALVQADRLRLDRMGSCDNVETHKKQREHTIRKGDTCHA